jgi:hypothetical protein
VQELQVLADLNLHFNAADCVVTASDYADRHGVGRLDGANIDQTAGGHG